MKNDVRRRFAAAGDSLNGASGAKEAIKMNGEPCQTFRVTLGFCRNLQPLDFVDLDP